jgi:hypothetical protein
MISPFLEEDGLSRKRENGVVVRKTRKLDDIGTLCRKAKLATSLVMKGKKK